MIVYISIGNSDDKLPQAEWCDFISDVDVAIRDWVDLRHGCWHSMPTSPWQNACWCVDIEEEEREAFLKKELSQIARTYGQDSIAWAEAPTTEFLGPSDD